MRGEGVGGWRWEGGGGNLTRPPYNGGPDQEKSFSSALRASFWSNMKGRRALT